MFLLSIRKHGFIHKICFHQNSHALHRHKDSYIGRLFPWRLPSMAYKGKNTNRLPGNPRFLKKGL